MKIEQEINNLLLNGFPTVTMFRINLFGKRLYCSSNPFKVYSGLTGALSACTFRGNQESKRLDKWRDKMINHLGGEGQQAYLNSMADFGTAIHECIARAWIQQGLNWEEEKEIADAYFRESALQNKIEVNEMVLQQQIFEYCKSAASLLSFLHNEVSELYSVEGMGYSDQLEIATPVDLFCKLKNGKTATLNIKTSSQISDSHREQVAIEKLLWNSTYQNADCTGIIRPKDWSMKKGIPTYELEILKADEEKKLADNAVARLMLAKNDENSTYLNFSKEVSSFSGQTKLGENPKIETKTLESFFNQ